MIGKKVSAQNSAVAIGGDNNAPIYNVTVNEGGLLHIGSSVAGDRGLSSCLAKVIALVADQQLSEYGHAYQREISAEIEDKLEFNSIPLNDRLIGNYRKYSFVLDRAFQGVEQSNADARVLVRHRAGSLYSEVLSQACQSSGVNSSGRVEYSRQHSFELIDAVKNRLKSDILQSPTVRVDGEWLDLAVALVVTEAIAECDVLEKRPNVVAS